MNKLNQNQLRNIKNFSKLVNTIIPQIKGPTLLIKFLANILPDYCVFERAIFYRGHLVVYIPKLCTLNPFYEAIIQYRLSSYNSLFN